MSDGSRQLAAGTHRKWTIINDFALTLRGIEHVQLSWDIVFFGVECPGNKTAFFVTGAIVEPSVWLSL